MGGFHSEMLTKCKKLARGVSTEGHLEREANEKAYSQTKAEAFFIHSFILPNIHP